MPRLDVDRLAGARTRRPGTGTSDRTLTLPTRILHYAIAAALPALVLGLRMLAESDPSSQLELITLLLAVVIVAYIGGLGPGLAATAVAALGAVYFLIEPRHSLVVARLDDLGQLVAFVVSGVLVSLLAGALHSARRKDPARAPGTADIEWKVRAGFAVALALLGTVSAVAYYGTGRMNAAANAARHAERSIDELRALVADVRDVETSVGRYVLTGDGAQLELYDAAVALTGAQLARLRRMTTDDATLRARFDGLSALVTGRLAIAAEVVALRRQNFASARAAIAGGEGGRLLARIRAGVDGIERAEDAVVSEEQLAADYYVWLTRITIVLGATLGSAFVLAALLAIGRDIAGRRRAEAALLEARDQLEARVRERTRELALSHEALRERQRQFGDIVASAIDAIVTVDDQQRIVMFNAAAEKVFGHSSADVLGQPLDTLLPARHRGSHRGFIAEFGRSGVTSRYMRGTSEVRGLRADGSEFSLEASISQAHTAGGVLYTAILRDVTESQKAARERREAEAALARSEERFRQMAESIDEVFWLTDVRKNQILYVSPAFESIWGRTCASLYLAPRQWVETIHPDDRRRVLEAAMRQEHGDYDEQYRVIRPDGSIRFIRDRAFPVHDADGRVYRIAGVARDVTERRSYEDRIEYLATYDALTDLPNRNLWNDRIGQALARARRVKQPLALLFLDLDRFKFLNDSYGHAVGDALLKEVARRLRGVVREEDTVARLSGDEFIVTVLDLAHAGDAAGVARKIVDELRRPFQVDGRELFLTASVGISLYPDDGDDAGTLLRQADAAMYRAKEQGGNDFQFYTREMGVQARERTELERALRTALQRNEFELYYQPQIDLRSGAVRGAEALIRWHHTELGLISPGRFIPLAEQTGLITSIGEWVLETACRQAQRWHTAGRPELTIGVNVSARQFHQRRLAGLVRDVLARTGLDPRRLELELTESTLMQDTDGVLETFRELKALGVSLAIDDFGTGYSSLSYLKRFPIDVVKIDQTFIRDLTTNTEDASITRAIIAMARSLDMRTIAEGVETRDQAALLSAYDCDEIQGMFFSGPLPAGEFERLLRESRRLPDLMWMPAY